jgi:hypothetical protein
MYQRVIGSLEQLVDRSSGRELIGWKSAGRYLRKAAGQESCLELFDSRGNWRTGRFLETCTLLFPIHASVFSPPSVKKLNLLNYMYRSLPKDYILRSEEF